MGVNLNETKKKYYETEKKREENNKKLKRRSLCKMWRKKEKKREKNDENIENTSLSGRRSASTNHSHIAPRLRKDKIEQKKNNRTWSSAREDKQWKNKQTNIDRLMQLSIVWKTHTHTN